MFSFSIKWLWAQCLMIGAGLFLLGQLKLPDESSLSTVSGRIVAAHPVSRKGLNPVYELVLDKPGGGQERLLIARSTVAESALPALIGKELEARVNWSAEAVSLNSGPTELAERIAAQANASKRWFDLSGIFAVVLGLSLGAATLLYGFGRAKPD
jgi:hypothetical protein